MHDVIIVYWRDIPAQVIVGKGRRATKIQLSERFEQAIDRAAMKSDQKSTDDYLAEWRKAKPFKVKGNPENIAKEQAEKLEVAKHHSLADLPCWRLNSNLVSVVPSVVGVFTKSADTAIAIRTSFLFHLCFKAESGEWKGH